LIYFPVDLTEAKPRVFFFKCLVKVLLPAESQISVVLKVARVGQIEFVPVCVKILKQGASDATRNWLAKLVLHVEADNGIVDVLQVLRLGPILDGLPCTTVPPSKILEVFR
jgi:hypothetical protein